MKKFLLLIILFFAISLSAQVTITMEQDGGVYKVPCVVNGAKMKFIFDTGAATVCLSETMAEYLLDNDYITKDDILGTGTSQVADGRIVDHVKINLRDIEIAGLHLKDVEAVVVEGQRAPLLLGQSAIQKIGKVSIEGNKLTIHVATDNYEDKIHAIKSQAEYLQESKQYHNAALKWEEYYILLWEHGTPYDPNAYCCIADNYFWCKEYDSALKWYTKVLEKNNWNFPSNINVPVFAYNVALCHYALENYSAAQYYSYQSGIFYFQDKNYNGLAQASYIESMAYSALNNNNKALERAVGAVGFYITANYPHLDKLHKEKYYGQSWGFLEKYQIPYDKTLADYLYWEALCATIEGNIDCAEFRVAAKMGSTDAYKYIMDTSCYGN